MSPDDRPNKGKPKRGPEPLRVKIDDVGEALTRIMHVGKPPTSKKKRAKKK